MKKIDILQEGMKIPKVEYDVYSKLSGLNLEKLNLSICSECQISLLNPSIIKKNLDIYIKLIVDTIMTYVIQQHLIMVQIYH